MVGPVHFAKGPVPNVSAIPLVTGQWKPGGKFKMDMDIVSNDAAPAVPVNGTLRALA